MKHTNDKSRPGHLPYGPFKRWLQREYERLGVVSPDDPAFELAQTLGISEKALYHYRHGLNRNNEPSRLVPFLVVVECLHAAGVDFGELYPRWCSSCGAHTRNLNHYGLCKPCLDQAGGRAGEKRRSTPKVYDEALLVRAQALYEEHGWSFRKIARVLLPQTTSASVQALANSLNKQARRRGWKVRDRIEATVAAHTKHGLSRRVTPTRPATPQMLAFRHRKRIAKGEVRGVRCKGTTKHNRNGNQGQQCARAAMRGSDYCIAHDPERRAELLVGLERARRNLPKNQPPPLGSFYEVEV